MLVEYYIEALLVDPEAADQVWEAWDTGKVSDSGAILMWWVLAGHIRAAQRPDQQLCAVSTSTTLFSKSSKIGISSMTSDNHDKLILYRRIYVSPHTAIGVEVDMLDMVTMIAPAFPYVYSECRPNACL